MITKATDNTDLQYWYRQLDDSEAMLQQFHDDWEKNYRAVFGKDWIGRDGKTGKNRTSNQGQDKTYQYDILLAFLKTEIPSLILYRPEIFLTATEEADNTIPEVEAEVKKYQSYTNQCLNDIDGFEVNVKAMVADAHCAYAIGKILSTPVLEPHPQAGESAGIDAEGNEITYPDYQPDPKGFDYDIVRVDPFNFRITAKCKNDGSKARWMGEEITNSLEEMIEDGIYDEDIIDELREKFGKNDKKDDEIDITRYEIYDRINNRLIVFCRDYDKFLRDDDIPGGIDKDPYAILKLTEIPGQFIPKPEMSSGRKFQDDEQEARQWIRRQAKKSVPKIGISPQFAKNTKERKRLEDGVSDTVTCTQNDIFPINSELKIGTVVSDYMTVMKRDFDEIMGQPSQDRGIVAEKKVLATELNVAEQSGTIREQDKLNTVKVWLGTIIEKLLFQIKHNGDAQLRQLQVDLDCNVEIDIESKSLKNKAIDRKQLTEVLTIVAQNSMFMQSPTLLDQIFRDYDIREKDKIIQELQAAVQAQMQAQQPPTAEPQKPGLNLSLSLKHELLPTAAVDKIVDMIMQADIPINTASSLPQPSLQADPGGITNPRPAESVGAGTEGMSPGSGLKPSGAIT